MIKGVIIDHLPDVAIIGAGPVGLFCVTACGMLGMKSVCIENLPFAGGQCMALYPEKKMYGIPGIIDENADEFVSRLLDQANSFSPKLLLGHHLNGIQKVEDFFILHTDKDEVRARSVIVASGKGVFTPNRPPLDNIDKFEGKSVLYSIKDKSVFKGKNVCIAGGGDSAVDWCIELAEIAKKVTIVHRRNKFRCSYHTEKEMRQLSDDGKVEIKVPFQLHGLIGDEALQFVEIINSDDELERLEMDFLLPFFGLANKPPMFGMDSLKMDDGRVVVDLSTMESSIKGLFAIGDACYYQNKLPLIVNGFGEAAQAATCDYHALYPDTNKELIDIVTKK